ncbi:MAG TPA: HAD family hydrolase [Chthonomonadaceae bacterium]|nr:HAD family hydrolase [Chthonomonadaceae bacterium]
MAIRWVFFDIGDVLFDEDVPHLYYFHSMLLAMRRNGVDVEWDAYHARIQQYARVKPGTAVLDAARYYVPDDALWDKIYHEGRAEYEAMRKPRPYGLLLDGITPVVRALHADFRLGIIANQHPPILQALDDYGIGPLFAVKAIDEVVGLSKPDPAMFRWALERAECAPEEAVMVGDRPDNDIAPAKTLGMGTIRFQRGILYTFYEPQRPEERADILVRDIMRLAPAVYELANRGRNS